MNWRNVRAIFEREVRDQLRDRRTLFMILVLPVLLYPLLGLSMFQMAQFVSEHATRVLLIGADDLHDKPPLLDDGAFHRALFNRPERAALVAVTVEPRLAGETAEQLARRARRALDEGAYEAVVYFPHDFASRLDSMRTALTRSAAAEARDEASATALAEAFHVPAPTIFYHSAKEKSQITLGRVNDALERWIDAIGRENMAVSGLPPRIAQPFDLSEHDLAERGHRDAAVWAKVLPFLLLIWALTGAFYPAVDLCAGEKERGTLETLLVSPAERSEIVCGKLLAVMAFSMATAILNLASMGLSFTLMLQKLKPFGAPPPLAALWLLAALVPVSALFSAVCLALAAFARSSKEAQYYLMPVVLVTMPLVILPMAPNVELTLGNSLIPLTGVVLVLRALLEGDYSAALIHLPAVSIVTGICCVLAIRWAVDQFNQESVLFRESERLGPALWVRHLLRDREATPTPTAAVFCGALILLVRFVIELASPAPSGFRAFAVAAVVSQLVVIATPALLMTLLCARSVRQTLSLRWPAWTTLPAAVVLALVLQPAVMRLRDLVAQIYPLNPEIARALESLFADAPSPWLLVLLLAVVPAICEELAFRGFILSGFRRSGHTWRAVAMASFCFAITHAIVPQAIVAFVLGLVLGYIAVQTGSILPPILFHMTNNAAAVLLSQVDAATVEWLRRMGFVTVEDSQIAGFAWPVVLAGLAWAAAILLRLRRLPHPQTDEERLEDAIHARSAHAVAR